MELLNDLKISLFQKGSWKFFRSGTGLPLDKVINGFLRKLNMNAGDVVLDVGGSMELLIPYIMKFTPGKIMVVAISEKMFKNLTDKYQNRYAPIIEILHPDLRNLSIADSSVDNAIGNCFFYQFQDQPETLSELYRVLRAGGRLTIYFTGKTKMKLSLSFGLLREDLVKLISLVKRTGFRVIEVIENEKEFFLLTMKP